MRQSKTHQAPGLLASPAASNGSEARCFGRVLITGINGFVGPYVAKRFLETGASVWGFVKTRADESEREALKRHGIDREVQLIEGDLLGPSSVGRALQESSPDVVIHLAAQSFVQQSFHNPTATVEVNAQGTVNLLEALRLAGSRARFLFAGSSEEYGLVVASGEQLASLNEKYGHITPQPSRLPELPITEDNPLRPVSPYAVTKAFGDYLTRVYAHGMGLDALVSRAFNHEGASRGPMFVTSAIAAQVARVRLEGGGRIVLGNVNAIRDWSHVEDVVQGYHLLAQHGEAGQVYNIGSQRTNSVLTYLLWALEEAGHHIHGVETWDGTKRIEDPAAPDTTPVFGLRFEKSRADQLLLEGAVYYDLEDRGLLIYTDRGAIEVEFDPQRFRPLEVPILLCSAERISALGFKVRRTVPDVIRDQLRFYHNQYAGKGERAVRV